jgi:hypothetical protein
MDSSAGTLVTMVVRPGSRGSELAERAAVGLAAGLTLGEGVADFVLDGELPVAQARLRIGRVLDSCAADWPRHLYFPTV